MKKLLIFSAFMTTLVSCQKDVGLSQEIQIAENIKTCFLENGLPTLEKKDIYIEGEIDNKYFSISNEGDYLVSTSLSTFFADGYNVNFATENGWQGNNFEVRSLVYLPGNSIKQYFIISINFQTFKGDKMAYLNYFNQFQKGNTFKFRTTDNSFKSQSEPETISLSITVLTCKQSMGYKTAIYTTEAAQSNSYFRVADVKEDKDASGQITKRNVTIEFDATLGLGQTLRIKNGRFFFSY